MDDEQRFEIYRLQYIEAKPDSEWKAALIQSIKQKLEVLHARRSGELR